MATRLFSSISVETTLASTINSAVTSMTVATGTATTLLGGVTLTANTQFTVALDPDTANEEIVFITAGPSGDTFTISRGEAGSAAVSHSTGATVKHVLTSDDLTAFAAGISPVASLGFSGSTSGITTLQATAIAGTNTLSLPPTTTDTLAGIAATQTLTNKTLTAPKINLSLNAQTGTTYTLVAADSGKLVTSSNASPVTITVPPSIFAAGEQINIQSIGAGITSLAQGAGVTITSTGATSSAPSIKSTVLSLHSYLYCKQYLHSDWGSILMATTYKVLGQSAPTAATATSLYTVPSVTEAVISTINVVNTHASTADVIRIAVRPNGATLANEHYIVYSLSLAAGSTFTYTGGVTVDATDVITVYSTNGTSSFGAFGSEIA
jgi:hypothetical protein